MDVQPTPRGGFATTTMQMAPDCIPCLLREALVAARRVTREVALQRTALLAAMDKLRLVPPGGTPADAGAVVHRAVGRALGREDPFLRHKQESNRLALSRIDRCREEAEAHDDPLRYLMTLAAAANLIDAGIQDGVDLDRILDRAPAESSDSGGYKAFRERLERVRDVLYLGDNAGEIVFDRRVVERIQALGKRVTFAVRSGPVLNDATREDASIAGIDRFADVISSGCRAPGTSLALATPDFRRRLERAPLVLSKGQGNYEGLSGVDASIFFVLRVKCDVVSKHLGVPRDAVTLRRGRGSTQPGEGIG